MDVVGKICCDLVGSYSLIAPSLRRFPPGLHDKIVELEGVLHIVGKIRRIGEAAVVFLGNPVGIVDIEKMQVREKGFVGLLFDEGGCRGNQFCGRGPVLFKVVVKPLVHLVLLADQAIGDESRRGISLPLEYLGHGGVALGEDVVRVEIPVR